MLTETPLMKPKPVAPVVAPKPGVKPTQPVGAMPASTPNAIPATSGIAQAGPILTSSSGDGFGSSAAVPAGLPITTTGGDGFGAAPAPAPTPSPAPFTTTPTNPNNALSAQTIAAGPGVDRFAVAQEKYDTFVKGTDPSYQAALRDASRRGAAMGGIGSGQLRSTFGDLATDRTNAIGNERSKLFTDALLGSVDDGRFATGVAQQQQGSQIGQQNDAFNRSLQQWMAGQSGGTGSGTALSGANAAGNGSQDALAALQAWYAQQGQQPTAPAPANAPAASAGSLPAWLQPYAQTPAYPGGF